MNPETEKGEGGREQILDCVSVLARSIGDLDRQSEILASLAMQYAEEGLLEDAAGTARAISDPYSHDHTLAMLAGKSMEFGDLEFAESLADDIRDEGLSRVAREQIVSSCAGAGRMDEALDIAQSLEDTGPAVAQIALAYANSGDLENALDLSTSISDVELRAPLLVQLAARAREEADEKRVSELLESATSFANRIELPAERLRALIEIAAGYKESGLNDEAFNTLRVAEKLLAAESEEGDDFASRDDLLVLLTREYARLHRFDDAERSRQEINDTFLHCSASAYIAAESSGEGEAERGIKMLNDARDVARSEEVFGYTSLRNRESALTTIALSYVRLGRTDLAFEAAEMIVSAVDRTAALRQVIQAAVNSSGRDYALKYAQKTEEPFRRAIFLFDVYDAEAAAADEETHNVTLRLAKEAVVAITDPFNHATAMMGALARSEETVRDPEETLSQILDGVADIYDPEKRSTALLELTNRYREFDLLPREHDSEILEEIASSAT